jgi:hypothetical protein
MKRFLIEFIGTLIVLAIMGFILAVVKASFYTEGVYGVY